MNESRLLRLADLLEADAANPSGVKFDISTWAAKDGYDEKNYSFDNEKFLFESDSKAIPIDCGTVACAVGLAAISGIFASEGLGWAIYPPDGVSTKGALIPTFQEKQAFDAVEAFFDIRYKDASRLFTSDGYPSELAKGAEGELAVANKIREYVKGGII